MREPLSTKSSVFIYELWTILNHEMVFELIFHPSHPTSACALARYGLILREKTSTSNVIIFGSLIFKIKFTPGIIIIFLKNFLKF